MTNPNDQREREAGEFTKQPLNIALVEHGLCYCFDDNSCHYHEELDRLRAQNEKFRKALKRINEEALSKTMDTVELEYWLQELCDEALNEGT